jgi:hypothetical protein
VRQLLQGKQLPVRGRQMIRTWISIHGP